MDGCAGLRLRNEGGVESDGIFFFFVGVITQTEKENDCFAKKV